MAIVKATEHWRAYLHGSPVLLKSDHKPLVYLNGKAELGMRLSRWMEALCDLTFEIGYVKGKDNAAADALSRRSDHEAVQEWPSRQLSRSVCWRRPVRAQPMACPWTVDDRAERSAGAVPAAGQPTETQLRREPAGRCASCGCTG